MGTKKAVKTCQNCSHFKVCKIIAAFRNALARHRKIFKPVGIEGRY